MSEDMNLAKKLRDDRQKLWHDAKGILDIEDRSAEQDKHLDTLMDKIDEADVRLKVVLEAEKRSRETDEAYNLLSEKPVERAGVASRQPQFEENLRKFIDGDPYVKSIDIPRTDTGGMDTRDIYLRTLGTGGSASNTQGTAVVPIDFYNQLVAYMIEVSGILQAGPTILKTTGGEQINIPVATAHVTATTAAQAGTITSSEPSLSQKPLNAQKFAHIVYVSRELIDDKAVDLLGYLAMTAGRALGNAFGSAIVNGGNGITGGLLASISAGVTGQAASAISGQGQIAGGAVYNDLIDMEASVISPYRQSRNCYWLGNDKTILGFRKLKDANGRPLWEPSTVLGTPDLLVGKPVLVDPFMPAVATSAKSLVFGDFRQVLVRLVGGLRFERSDDFKFDSDVISFRAVIRGDANVADATGLKYFVGNAA